MPDRTGKSQFRKIKGLLCDPHLNLNLRIQLFLRCCVSTILGRIIDVNYFSHESIGSLRNVDLILKTPWTDHRTNIMVLQKLNKERELRNIVKIHKISYLGHILKNKKYILPQLVVKG